MADKAPKKEKGMTVFRSDRHEDMAAIVGSALVVVCVLIYMAFMTGPISLTAPSDGKVLNVAVSEKQPVKKGDVLLSMEVKEKKAVNGQIEEKVVKKDITSKMNGTVMKIAAASGSSVSKDKDLMMVIEPEKGSLP